MEGLVEDLVHGHDERVNSTELSCRAPKGTGVDRPCEMSCVHAACQSCVTIPIQRCRYVGGLGLGPYRPPHWTFHGPSRAGIPCPSGLNDLGTLETLQINSQCCIQRDYDEKHHFGISQSCLGSVKALAFEMPYVLNSLGQP